MNDTDRYVELRKQYPNLGEDDGAVPVDKIQALVSGLADCGES